MSRKEALPPNLPKLEDALRSIGYSFETAVADVIDNSIDAQAENVHIRIIMRKDGHLDLALWDNGKGMDEKTLTEALRFGTDASSEIKRLGKFGLGLKLASLSQARELQVVTVNEGQYAGRAWLEGGIAEEFSSTVYDSDEVRPIMQRVFPDRMLRKSGTIVIWSNLYRVAHGQGVIDERANRLMSRLEKHLALAFHRYLSGHPRRVIISLDIFDDHAKASGVSTSLDPLNPFGYDYSGNADFPTTLQVAGEFNNQLAVRAHIWPPNSSDANYRLPGGANSRQGFYFYRNNRLIQGGGWNGMRETEPHTSLARLEVDLSPNMDVIISLDVKKIEIQLPSDVLSSIQKAKNTSGVDFKKFIAIADETYRRRTLLESDLPLIPSEGLPSPLSKFLHNILQLKKTSKHRDLKFKWKHLSNNVFFDIDREAGHLYLNKRFRSQLLHGLSGSSADIPVVKCLLFLVLNSALSSQRMGSKIKDETERVNRILVEAVKYERIPE